MTESRKKILDYLNKRMEDGFPPSVREICDATGLKSTSTVHMHLKKLEEDGYITRDNGLNRGIRVNRPAQYRSASVPIIGNVTAGLPILAVQDIEGYVTVNESLANGYQLFALHIQGDSMINAGIYNDDIAVFKRTTFAENGKIVVALIGDEATVKRFYKENGIYRLQPENPSYEPIIVNEVTILGELVSLIRYY